MMKTRFIFFQMLVVLSLTGCFQDEGNYDYKNIGKVFVSGYEESYTVVSDLTPLSITMNVELEDPDMEVDYLWTMYAHGGVGTNKIDTIARTKDLQNQVLRGEAREYRLEFRIRETKTGVCWYTLIPVTISTEYTKGWYVLKETAEGNTELDLQTDAGCMANLLKAETAMSYRGKPQGLGFTESYMYVDTAGNRQNKSRCLFVQSEEQMGVWLINSMKLIHDYTNCFYMTPAFTPKQSGSLMSDELISIFDESGMYSYSSMTMNVGLFGEKRLYGSDYRISNKGMFAFYGGSAIVFDELSRSWLGLGAMHNNLLRFNDNNASNVCLRKPYDMDLQLVWGGNRMLTTSTAYAVLDSMVQPRKRIVQTLNKTGIASKRNPITKEYVVPADKNLYQSDVICSHCKNATLYCAVGNRLYAYDMNGMDNEVKMDYPFAENEEITYITHFNSTASDARFEKFVVATFDGVNYKLYLFDLEFGRISGEPVVYEGVGKVKRTLFVSGNSSALSGSYVS